jgi:hypothetical protein
MAGTRGRGRSERKGAFLSLSPRLPLVGTPQVPPKSCKSAGQDPPGFANPSPQSQGPMGGSIGQEEGGS